jgi:hypothetical protein
MVSDVREMKNPSSSTAHGVIWSGGPATPTCAGVPGASSGQPSFATSWSGTCTFAKAGEYTFYCTVHGPSMSGKVIVNSSGETTVTTTSTSTPGYPPPANPGGGGNSPYPGYEVGSQQPVHSALALLAGSTANAVKVAARQHGHVVRGSVVISPAGEGARLQIDLFVRSPVLARAGHGALVKIGRLVVSHVHAGAVSFSVALSRTAREALARHRRLAVSVRVALQAAGAKPVTVARAVLLRP